MASSVTVKERPAATGPSEARRVVLIPRGRGRVGKSTLAKWAIGRAREAGREVIVADFDRNNPTLSGFYADARTPKWTEAEDMVEALTGLLNEVALGDRSLVLDLGGGDELLNQVGRTSSLVEFFEASGVEPLCLLCLGPDQADLQHITAIDQTGAFAPERTLLVLNGGLVPMGRDVLRAFTPVMESRGFRSLLDRGAQPVVIPALPCMEQIERLKLDFWAAKDGQRGSDSGVLGPFQRSQTQAWLYGRLVPNPEKPGEKKLIPGMEQVFGPWEAWLP